MINKQIFLIELNKNLYINVFIIKFEIILCKIHKNIFQNIACKFDTSHAL